MSPAPAGGRGACARGGAAAVTCMNWALSLERGSDEANGFVPTPGTSQFPGVLLKALPAAPGTQLLGCLLNEGFRGAGVYVGARACVCEALGGGVPH